LGRLGRFFRKLSMNAYIGDFLEKPSQPFKPFTGDRDKGGENVFAVGLDQGESRLARRLRALRENPTAWQCYETGKVLAGYGLGPVEVRTRLSLLARLYGVPGPVLAEALAELEAAGHD